MAIIQFKLLLVIHNTANFKPFIDLKTTVSLPLHMATFILLKSGGVKTFSCLCLEDYSSLYLVVLPLPPLCYGFLVGQTCVCPTIIYIKIDNFVLTALLNQF